MAMKLFPLFFYLLLVLCSACSSETSPPPPSETAAPKPPAPRRLPPGELHAQVSVQGQANYRYALWTPSEDGQLHPVVLALDPQADALLPLELYRPLAEEKGWIIAASYSSKNGVPPQQNVQAAAATLDELKNLYPVDPKRIYVMGFSGGARSAALVARQREDVAGVIACAAGYPIQPGERAFSYYGLVGNEDFNYLEMLQMRSSLTSLGKPNWIEEWEGAHQWPPVEAMAQAWEWLDLRAMAYGSMNRDEAAIAAQKAALEGELKNARGIEKLKQLEKLLSWMRDLEATDEWSRELAELGKQMRNSSARKQEQALFQRESDLRRDYQFSLQTEDRSYWEREAPQLHRFGNAQTAEGKMYKRILGYLSVLSYSYSTQYIQQNDLGNAEKHVQIYAWIDPPNAEHAVLKAKIAARRQQADPAMAALEEARILGFEDALRIQNDPDFSFLQNRPEFHQLLQALPTKALP